MNLNYRTLKFILDIIMSRCLNNKIDLIITKLMFIIDYNPVLEYRQKYLFQRESLISTINDNIKIVEATLLGLFHTINFIETDTLNACIDNLEKIKYYNKLIKNNTELSPIIIVKYNIDLNKLLNEILTATVYPLKWIGTEEAVWN
uniref:Uncharacterized protein n=1 Tax=viral metagenome TaxID=1070528 RepID=A0A6C0IXU6_9ZZZZ